MTFGEKLQRLRKARGWTQEQLAEQAGVSRQSLSKWEGGAALPDTANVVALADLFGVTTDCLLREGGEAACEPAPTAPKRVSMRDVWGWVLLALGISAMFMLRLLASLYPVNYGNNDVRYHGGLWAYLLGNDLLWLWYAAIAAAAAGAVLLALPWLHRAWRKWCNALSAKKL